LFCTNKEEAARTSDSPASTDQTTNFIRPGVIGVKFTFANDHWSLLLSTVIAALVTAVKLIG